MNRFHDDRFGRGWALPLAPSGSRGALVFTGGAELVRQAIRVILVTEPGERLMRPDFGCGLRQFLTLPNTPGTRAAIGRAVEESLAAWEPRITVRTVDVRPGDDPSLAVVTVSYTHVRDGSTDDLRLAVPVGTARTTGV
ncbi:GPW/gp25 family protein [Streptomyces chartreusis]|uniref:GPW/gp25 family protein n=1 Tax=Streptomyces chartreusis TaxID=1969 RepID=UPI003811099B